MRLGFLAVLPLLFLPGTALADTVPAGFAPGSLWVSTTQATAGDSITIYTVVYDSAVNPIEGDVSFMVDGDSIAGQHFKLAAGASQILSAKWTASAGAHSFSASIANVSGLASSTIEAARTNTAQITVAAAAPSPLSQVSDTLSSIVASSSPAVQNIAQSVFGATEDLREKGADWLSSALYDDQSGSRAASSSILAPKGQVLGASTFRPAASSTSALESAKRALLSALLYIFQVRVLFYLLLVFVLYILFKVIQGFFRYRE